MHGGGGSGVSEGVESDIHLIVKCQIDVHGAAAMDGQPPRVDAVGGELREQIFIRTVHGDPEHQHRGLRYGEQQLRPQLDGGGIDFSQSMKAAEGQTAGRERGQRAHRRRAGVRLEGPSIR